MGWEITYAALIIEVSTGELEGMRVGEGQGGVGGGFCSLHWKGVGEAEGRGGKDTVFFICFGGST